MGLSVPIRAPAVQMATHVTDKGREIDIGGAAIMADAAGKARMNVAINGPGIDFSPNDGADDGAR